MNNAENTEKKKKLWMIPVAVLLLALLAAAVYIIYVFATYSRIEDNQPLEVKDGNSQEMTTGREYTAISYNIGFGAYTADFTFFMDEGKESRARSRDSVITCVNGTTDAALSFDPDFVLFQEVDTDSTRSWHVDESAMIIDSFSRTGSVDSVFAQNYHSAYLLYPFTEPHGASNSGLLTISRADVSGALRRSLPVATSIKKILDLDRCYSISRIPVAGGKELVLINTHLSAYGTDASQGNAQLELLFSDMQKEYEKGNYVICGGDFNHDFTGDSVAYFNHGSDVTYSWCNPFPDDLIPEGFYKCTDYAEGMEPTARYDNEPYNENSFVMILDGFIVSDNVECRYVQNVQTHFAYTDHNPVVMKFTLK